MKKLKGIYQYSDTSGSRKTVGAGRQKSLSQDLKRAYVSRYSETGFLQNYVEGKMDKNVRIIRYRDLAETEIEGYPYASDRDSQGELQFYFSLLSPNSHEIGVGTTGSGKSTGCVEPRLRALTSKKNKPFLFITDPKGELFERNAEHFRRQGYRIYLVNFKDVAHSDCWNPLTEIYDCWIRQKGLKDIIKRYDTCYGLDHFKMQDPEEDYVSGFWTCEEKAFASIKTALEYIENKRAEILSETDDLINQLVPALIPDKLVGDRDPSWGLGSRDILSSLIYLMLEDALDERSGFTRDNMNLMTIQHYFECIREEVLVPASPSSNSNTPLLNTRKLSHKRPEDISIRQLRTYFENAATTSRCYMGSFRNAMQPWFSSKIYTICNGNTVDIENCMDQPFAIFLSTRDYEKSDFTIAGLFIDWVYRKMLERAENGTGRLEREMYFILDEFANIPAIKDFENKISTSRSRNIWFHMFIQSYAQLEMVYSITCTQTILDNCNSHVFLGSQNFETKTRFAKECGKRTIPNLESVLNPASHSMIEIPLITVSKLEELNPGEMYIRRAGMPLTLARCERSYLCKEFTDDPKVRPEDLQIKSLPYTAGKYRYAYLESNMGMVNYSKLVSAHAKKTEISLIL